MNYLKHYTKLMRKAEQRGWTKASAPCYVEGHHTFIKAIFGENDRVVYLTAREHFVAHLLLWKACRKRYGVQHKKTAKTGKALQSMSMNSRFTSNRHVANSHEFEMARTANIESMRGDNHWSRQEGAVSPFIALNKDPVRAAAIGEINRKREKESWDNGTHPWQNPVFIESKRQRMVGGQAAAMGSMIKGKLWWTNGEKETRAHECPGEGWVEGRLPGIDYSHKNPMVGSRNPMARAIYLKHLGTGELEFFESIADAKRKYKINNINLVLTGHRKSAGGFTAFYARLEK